jgi:ubiquinone/menaquinone biosynthesis C-methylase UbiE
MRPIEAWLNDDAVNSIYSARYWNDIEEEKKKQWWILDGDYQKCLDYLRSSGFLSEFEYAKEYVSLDRKGLLKVVDLAAGIGWISALLSRLSNVGEVHAVEISKHRLSFLFERCVKLFEGDEEKISRYLGSFYDLKFDDRSMDIIFLSQAFHHAEKPLALSTECDRVLSPGGRIILIGEHYITGIQVIRKFMSFLIRRRKIITNFYELFPSDEKTGDHYYRVSDYYFIFKSLGYQIRHQRLGNKKVVYIVDKPLH